MDLQIMINIARLTNFISSLNKGNFYLSSHSFEICLYIRGMKVGNKCKISSQYLYNYASWAKKTLDMGREYHYRHRLLCQPRLTWRLLL